MNGITEEDKHRLVIVTRESEARVRDLVIKTMGTSQRGAK